MIILTYDVGTTGVKTCLYAFQDEASKENRRNGAPRTNGEDRTKVSLPQTNTRTKNALITDGEAETPFYLLDSSYATYGLKVLPNGGAEQDPEEWWDALCATTQELVARYPEWTSRIAGISFCAQAQSLVLLDQNARPVRNSMSYMDQRSGTIRNKYSGQWPRIAGASIPFVISSLYHTGVMAASDKDPVWKYLWVKEHEPEIYQRVYKWMDVKDALIARMTGRFTMSRDSAFATLLLDRKAPNAFSKALMKRLGINPDHMPEIVESEEKVGGLLPEAAETLGLKAGIPVFSGGSDAALIGVGSGCVYPGQAHIYMGTSGWASVVTDRNTVDIQAMIASVVGVQEGLYNYFAELETAGKCLEWVRDHLALDEINIYLSKTDVSEDPESTYESLYDYLSYVIDQVPDGSNGVISTPWLHGNRCPFEDASARTIFFNIGLETGKTELIRSVVEGVCYHMRWFVETIERKIPIEGHIRFVGGGALSPVTAGILANILQRPVETVEDPQNVGAVGAAMMVARGLGALPDLKFLRDFIPADHVYLPDPSTKDVHDLHFSIYKKLYGANRSFFKLLNE